MELTDELKQLFIQAADKLTGSTRRVFMAHVAQVLGKGGQRRAEVELGWNRGTIRTGQQSWRVAWNDWMLFLPVGGNARKSICRTWRISKRLPRRRVKPTRRLRPPGCTRG